MKQSMLASLLQSQTNPYPVPTNCTLYIGKEAKDLLKIVKMGG
jgi:hypothetical protein